MKKIIWILLLAVTAQAQASVSGKHPTSAFLDLLYWQVRESGADNWGQVAVGSSTHTKYQVLSAPFDWNTGVRVGLAQAFNQNSYDVLLAYTHYQTTASNSASGTVISSFDGNYFANNTDGASLDLPYSRANIRYQFFFNAVDLNLGRQLKIDSILQFHPYIGLKAATINQNIYSNWMNPIPATDFTAATENLKNNFSGIGPTIGVDSSWSLYAGTRHSFDLIGNLAAGLLYGHTTISDIYANNKPVTITVHNDSINAVSPMLDGLLALQWAYQFATSDMSVRLGYEAQIWFNQVQFYSLNMGKIIRPLSMQGGNLEFRFNF